MSYIGVVYVVVKSEAETCSSHPKLEQDRKLRDKQLSKIYRKDPFLCRTIPCSWEIEPDVSSRSLME